MLKKKTFDLTAEGRDLPHRDQLRDDGPLEAFPLRIHKKRREELERTFRNQGISTAAGLRMVIYGWLDRGGH